MYIVDPS